MSYKIYYIRSHTFVLKLLFDYIERKLVFKRKVTTKNTCHNGNIYGTLMPK